MCQPQSRTRASGALYGRTTRVLFSSSHLLSVARQWTPLPASYSKAVLAFIRFRFVRHRIPRISVNINTSIR